MTNFIFIYAVVVVVLYFYKDDLRLFLPRSFCDPKSHLLILSPEENTSSMIKAPKHLCVWAFIPALLSACSAAPGISRRMESLSSFA